MSQHALLHLGEYEIQREIGRGGMGVVYEGRHPRLNRRVAIKTFVFGPTVTPKERARFNVEIQAAARLQHSGIVTVFEAGETDGRPFYAMEFVEGGTLQAALRDGPWEPRRAALLVRDVARAVDYAHEQGVIHRDLKPGNILLDSNGCPKVTDFGLAKCLDSGTDLTRTGQILGTAGYMAPEQALGLVRNIGPAVDQYALGTILYELLTGRPPFQSPDPIQTLAMVAGQEPIPPRVLQPAIPRDLEVICLKCLHKAPHRRYATTGELADDLDRMLQGQPILARPVGRTERTWKWMKRRPALTGLIFFVAVFVVTLTIGYLQLQAALQESEENLLMVHAVIERLSVEVADSLETIPGAEGVRIEVLETARELYETLAGIRPRNSDGRFLMAATLENLGRIHRQLGRSDEARTLFRRSLEQFEILLKADPHNREYLMGAAAVHDSLARLETNPENRVREHERALALMPVSDEPETLQQRGITLNNLSLALLSLDQIDAAEQRQREALAIRSSLADRFPGRIEYAVDLAVSHGGLGQIHLLRDDPLAALEHYTIAEELLAPRLAELTPEQRLILTKLQANRGSCRRRMDDWTGAATSYQAAIDVIAGLSREHPRRIEYQVTWAELELMHADLLLRRGEVDEARTHIEQAHDLSVLLVETGYPGADLLLRRSERLQQSIVKDGLDGEDPVPAAPSGDPPDNSDA